MYVFELESLSKQIAIFVPIQFGDCLKVSGGNVYDAGTLTHNQSNSNFYLILFDFAGNFNCLLYIAVVLIKLFIISDNIIFKRTDRRAVITDSIFAWL